MLKWDTLHIVGKRDVGALFLQVFKFVNGVRFFHPKALLPDFEVVISRLGVRWSTYWAIPAFPIIKAVYTKYYILSRMNLINEVVT